MTANGTANGAHPTITKAEAIRRVCARPGMRDATVYQIQQALKKEFGLEASEGYIYAERRVSTLTDVVVSAANALPDAPAAAPAVPHPEDAPPLLSHQEGLLLVKETAAKVGGLDRLLELIDHYRALVS